MTRLMPLVLSGFALSACDKLSWPPWGGDADPPAVLRGAAPDAAPADDAAVFYRYRDERGVDNVVDSLDSVPAKFRARAQRIGLPRGPDAPPSPVPPTAPAPTGIGAIVEGAGTKLKSLVAPAEPEEAIEVTAAGGAPRPKGAEKSPTKQTEQGAAQKVQKAVENAHEQAVPKNVEAAMQKATEAAAKAAERNRQAQQALDE